MLPKWFKGEVYEVGGIVTNPFSGKGTTLDAEELSMYDYIIGCQMLVDAMGGVWNPATAKYQKDMSRGISWFQRKNIHAYYVLLD